MAAVLITGPHQSGKSRRLWEMIRAEPPGTAVLVTPDGVFNRELLRQVHAWFGAGLLPTVISLGELMERCAAGIGDDRREVSLRQLAHWLQPWCKKALAETCWASIASYRAVGRELAEICQRLDDAMVSDQDLALVVATADKNGERLLAQQIECLRLARSYVHEQAEKRRLETRGKRAVRLASTAAAAPWRAIYCDDLMSVTPAQCSLLASLARDRTLVLTAVEDVRLGGGALVERLRRTFIDAKEEKLACIHRETPHSAGARTLLVQMLCDDRPIGFEAHTAAVGSYHYHDEAHAGRAIAALLRREQHAPGEVSLYVRACNERALALADSLIGAGVPVAGEFSVKYAGTAEGGLLSALGQWCARGNWESLLALGQRLAIADPAIASDKIAPLHLPDLCGPWGSAKDSEGLAALKRLTGDRDPIVDRWGWSEVAEGRPLLRRTIAWLEGWRSKLAATGTWLLRLGAAAEHLALGDEGRSILRTLSDLDRDHPVAQHDLDEIIGATPIAVKRGAGLDQSHALLIHDAVRGRTRSRPIAIIHDLEHGVWPLGPPRARLLSQEQRRALGAQLGERDPFDEQGRQSGELASFLAACARGHHRLIFGICCGERQPSPWLVGLARQLGWNLEEERRKESAEAMPGAPLSPADSQGDGEQALWQPLRKPDFSFRIPPQKIGKFRLSPSDLNTLLADPFALVCEQLGCLPPLGDRSRQQLGIDLHDLLARTIVGGVLDEAALRPLLDEWIGKSADAAEEAARRRQRRTIEEAVAKERALFATGGTAQAEQWVDIKLDVAGEVLQMRGRADRIDRLEGAVRIVDYKSGRIGSFREALKEATEGQLLAYCLGIRQGGHKIIGAHYRGLGDAAIVGYRAVDAPYKFSERSNADQGIALEELDVRLQRLRECIIAFAEGRVSTSGEGLCADRGFGPIARLDEARLDLGNDGEGDESDD